MNGRENRTTGGDEVIAQPLNQLLSIRETAQKLGICEKSVRRLVSRRGLPCIRIGRLVKFDPGDVFRWLEARKED